jgi:hypothetical protein
VFGKAEGIRVLPPAAIIVPTQQRRKPWPSPQHRLD